MTATYAIRLLNSLALFALAACTDNPPLPASKPLQHEAKTAKPAKTDEPPMTIQKAGSSMQLVRILEGGVCKNEREGVKGGFLLYADTEDMKRIKAEKGAKVFGKFERTITDLTLVTLQSVAQKLNYALPLQKSTPTDPQSNLPDQFTALFDTEIAASIAHFQKKSTLKIALQPFATELVFYQYNCEATKEAVEETGSDEKR